MNKKSFGCSCYIPNFRMEKTSTDHGLVVAFLNFKVDTDKLLDWKEKLSVKASDEEKLASPSTKREDEQNNNQLERGTLVNVNNTDIALFKYGETIIGGFEMSLMQQF